MIRKFAAFVALVALATVVYVLIVSPYRLFAVGNALIARQVTNPPFLSVDLWVPAARELERAGADVRREFDAVAGEPMPTFQDVDPSQRAITRDDRWTTFMLYVHGRRVEKNASRCPETAAALEKIPGMRTAFFSILAPGKRIPPHRGPQKGVLRLHLGVKIPKQNERCYIEVGGERYSWKEGEVVLFDDTYKHHVRNDTDESRCVLFVDVKRPGLTGLTAFVNDATCWIAAHHPRVRRAIARAEPRAR